MQITKDIMKRDIDNEMGEGFSSNINLRGYTFTKNGSFINFEFRYIEGVKTCYIKYIYFESYKDLITIMVNCCNFWMGNNIQFFFYKEKEKKYTVSDLLEELNFSKRVSRNLKWKYPYNCKRCGPNCKCKTYSFYK